MTQYHVKLPRNQTPRRGPVPSPFGRKRITVNLPCELIPFVMKSKGRSCSEKIVNVLKNVAALKRKKVK